MSNISNLAEAREARRLQQPHQSSGKGYALLHRKIMDVPFYKDAEAAHLWVHLILKAKHTPEYVMTDAGEILVYNLHVDICLERYPVEVLIHWETLGDIFKSATLCIEVIHKVKLVDHRLNLFG